MVKPSILLVAAVAASCFFWSCSSNTSVNNPSSGTAIHPPHVGSQFVFKQWRADSAQNKLDPVGGWTMIVADTGGSYFGKTNVTRLQYFSSDAYAYVNYEPNGDISVYDETLRDWRAWPIATQGAMTFAKTDTSAVKEVFQYHTTYTNKGAEDVFAAGHHFSAVKIEEDNRTEIIGTEDSVSRRSSVTWYAPETGWYVKQYAPPDASAGLPGYLLELTSYELK